MVGVASGIWKRIDDIGSDYRWSRYISAKEVRGSSEHRRLGDTPKEQQGSQHLHDV